MKYPSFLTRAWGVFIKTIVICPDITTNREACKQAVSQRMPVRGFEPRVAAQSRRRESKTSVYAPRFDIFCGVRVVKSKEQKGKYGGAK